MSEETNVADAAYIRAKQLKKGNWIEVPDMPLSSGLVTTSLDSPIPTQPKDSKEMGPIQPGTDEHEREFGSRECGAVAKCNQLDAALKSANERAEEAEKELATLKGAKRD